MSDRRPYAGEARRERALLEVDVGGPLEGAVRVVPVRLDSSWGDVQFAVEADWTGPGLPELGRATRAEVHDVYNVGDVELARTIAGAAEDELRAGRAPDLRELARRFA